MKAAVIQNKKIVMNEIETPTLDNRKGVIVKVQGCGICGSDIVKFRHGISGDGTVLGHEALGEIVEINSSSKFKKGERIVFGHHVPCYECVYCKSQNYSMCQKFKDTNIRPGGFCEYLYLSEDHLNNTAFTIPNNISDIAASFMEPSGCCLRAVKRTDVQNGDFVFVSGLGSIGVLMGQILKHFGATVIGCDILDERLDIAKQAGFDYAIKFTNDNEVKSKILEITNIGVDKVFLCSGNGGAVDFAVDCIRNGGKILVFSSVADDFKGFANNQIYYRELMVMGSYSPAPIDLEESLKLIEDGVVNLEKFVDIYSLSDIITAIDDTISNKIFKAYIKI